MMSDNTICLELPKLPVSNSRYSVVARLSHAARPYPLSLLVSACLASALFFVDPTTATAQEAPDSSTSTLGLAPPAGAVVLFDGSNFDAWKPFSFLKINPDDDQKEIQWKLVDGQAMQIAFEFEGKRRKQFLCTRRKFGDYRLHLEFQLPKKGSGNSGIFFGPLYELQILNSAGKESPGLGDCGAIYQIRVPDVNAALGPSEWQTVDLEFQAARFDAAGHRIERRAARVTVRLNGVLIHDDFKLSLRRNKYAAYPEEPRSHIILQEHGSPLKFRNIWLVENPESDTDEPETAPGKSEVGDLGKQTNEI